jgi:hypothetical protein
MGQSKQPTPVRIGDAAGNADAVSPDESNHDLMRFTLGDMVRCGEALRRLASESSSMEESAQKITAYLYERFRDRNSNNRECVLVRFFKTHAYGGLSGELRRFADSMAAGAALREDTKCLVLLGTHGDESQWNSRRMSAGHQAIPLLSEAVVEQSPMISQLIRQLGLTTVAILRPTPEIIKELDQKRYGVFHVSEAANSRYVPAQKDFVAPYGIASVLGFGGILPDGNLFTVIIFARVPTSPPVAEMFRTMALNLKLGLLAVLDKPVFAG